MNFLQVFALHTYRFIAWWRNSIKKWDYQLHTFEMHPGMHMFYRPFFVCFLLHKYSSTVTYWTLYIRGLRKDSTVLLPRGWPSSSRAWQSLYTLGEHCIQRLFFSWWCSVWRLALSDLKEGLWFHIFIARLLKASWTWRNGPCGIRHNGNRRMVSTVVCLSAL